MKDVAVRFGTGQEVLSSYWGYLSDGGLIIDDPVGLTVGEEISLSITIESSAASYRLQGRVVRHQPGGKLAVVAFRPGEPHDMLLTEALAETDDVPARRHRRFRVSESAEVTTTGSGEAIDAHIVNLSEHGCCVGLTEAAADSFPVGSSIAIQTPSFHAEGTVVWSHKRERGVAFAPASEHGAVGDLLRRL